ncbi:hypothetical protein D1872_281470 [compost metagenome]
MVFQQGKTRCEFGERGSFPHAGRSYEHDDLLLPFGNLLLEAYGNQLFEQHLKIAADRLHVLAHV